MSSIKSSLLGFFSGLRRGRHSRHRRTGGWEDIVEVCYHCDGCFTAIQEGSNRYNCTECEGSYDLCEQCHRRGEGKRHTQELGPLHTFSVETSSDFKLRSRVWGEHMEDTFKNAFHYFATRPAIGQYNPSLNNFTYITYGKLGALVRQFASGLWRLVGGASSPMLAIIGPSRLEWYITDFACIFLGIPTVPISVTADRESMGYILGLTEVSVVVCVPSLLEQLLELAEECPSLSTVITMEEVTDSTAEPPAPPNVRILSFAKVSATGKESPVKLTKLRPDPSSQYTIAFTSGSTGRPKGCVFSRHSWNGRLSHNASLGIKKIWLSFHPPAHNFERRNVQSIIISGGKVAIHRGAMEHLLDDFALVRPTVVASTPRFWTLLYNQYLQALYEAYCHYLGEKERNEEGNRKGEEEEEEEGRKAEGAVEGERGRVDEDGKEYECKGEIKSEGPSSNIHLPTERVSIGGPPPPIPPIPSHFTLDSVPLEVRQKVLRRFRTVLGGREVLVSTGGAPTAAAVKNFMIQCFNGIPQEGYGATEVGAIASNGSIFTETDVKLVDVPEMGYFTNSNPPRGEVCVKTPTMIDGYYKNPEETSQKFVDGYFRTGDIGEMGSDRHIRLIDRKKNFFKLAQGEFVAPERLEVLYVSSSRLVSQMYIYGDSLQSNIVAVVVPHEESLVHWWRERHGDSGEESPSVDDLCQLAEVRELYIEELRRVARREGLQGWEVPAGVILEPQPFSQEAGLLTTLFKKCRPKLERKYRAALEELYRGIGTAGSQRPLEIQLVEHFRAGDLPENLMTITFAQLGGDSLAAMRLSALIREHLHMDVSVETILKQTLGQILEIVTHSRGDPSDYETIMEADAILTAREPQHLSSHDNPSPHFMKARTEIRQKHSPQDIQWRDEIALDSLGLELCLETADERTATSNPKGVSVLLTGATGFLGRFILMELLQDHRCCRIYCLVQDKEGVSAVVRMDGILSELHYELGVEQPLSGLTAGGRLTVVAGDLTRPQLGMEEDEYGIICREVDVIIHNGAVVNGVLPYAALKAANVESTKEILRMVCSKRRKFLHYVSTIGVFAPLSPSEHIDEHTTPHQERLSRLSGYAQSKWVGESLVLQAIRKGLVAGSISRPGLIGPHSCSGHANLQDWVCWLVRGLATMGRSPRGEGCEGRAIHWVPVDHVARAVSYLSTDHRNHLTKHHIFHLASPTLSVEFSTLTDSLKKLFVPHMTTHCSYAEFRVALSREAREGGDSVLGSLDLILPRVGGWPHSHSYYSQETRRTLDPVGIPLGELPPNYLELYLQFLHHKGMI